MDNAPQNIPTPEAQAPPCLPEKTRYAAWQELEEGAFALRRGQDLVRLLFSGWPRRSRSLLVLNAGSGGFLESLWESGFDVTGQEHDPRFMALARERLGARADYVLCPPDHLPFADCSFDYAVAAAAFEFWEDPEAVLREVGRVVCGGFGLIVPNRCSLFGLECALRRKAPICRAVEPLLQNPRRIARMLRRAFGPRKIRWLSVLPGPSRFWKPGGRFASSINSLALPLPLGAIAGLHVDFGPMYSGTPLLLRAASPMPTAK